MAHGSRKQYWIIFVALAVLTALEVGVVYVKVGRGLLISALVALAVAKAALVGLYYMHLKSETPVLKLTVAIPLAIPGVYAAVLILEAAWRML